MHGGLRVVSQTLISLSFSKSFYKAVLIPHSLNFLGCSNSHTKIFTLAQEFLKLKILNVTNAQSISEHTDTVLLFPCLCEFDDHSVNNWTF